MKTTEIRDNLNKRVKFTNPKLYIEGAEYIFSGIIYRKDKRTGRIYSQAELTDITTQNSVIYCSLNDIEPFAPQGER